MSEPRVRELTEKVLWQGATQLDDGILADLPDEPFGPEGPLGMYPVDTNLEGSLSAYPTDTVRGCAESSRCGGGGGGSAHVLCIV